jgi:hypothetical protein
MYGAIISAVNQERAILRIMIHRIIFHKDNPTIVISLIFTEYAV